MAMNTKFESNKKLLILDIDETLIHACYKPLARTADDVIEDIFVYERPFVRRFLEFCLREFAVAVWTSAQTSYAHSILELLLGNTLPLQFVWCRERCTRRFDVE